jgi:transglutaminase-like putative cysteine protease
MHAMAEEPIAFHRAAVSGRDAGRNFPENAPAAPVTRFDRSELNRILTVYGRMVAEGEWRDYALDFLEDVAVFSIFRRTSEMPLFRIEKRPKLRGRQGQYCVIAAGGLILKRGHELTLVLKVFDKKRLQALAD